MSVVWMAGDGSLDYSYNNIDGKNWTYSRYILELRLIKLVDGEENKITTQIYKKESIILLRAICRVVQTSVR